jgi:CRISPR-associated protein Cmr3
MNTHSLFIEPLDVLFLRGNKLFGDPGSFGESLVPPWPSVAAGAIRSRMLADAGVDVAGFARGEIDHPALGTPARPGPFAVSAFHLARHHRDGRIEALFALPADLVVTEYAGGTLTVKPLMPTLPAGGVLASAPFALLPVLAESGRSKAATGYWLTDDGWRDYLAGQVPAARQLVRTEALWKLDHRVGVGLDATTGRAADGRLFSVQAVAMVKRGHRIGTDEPSGNPVLADYDLGFLAAVVGAEPPANGTLRLGGDGRAAAVTAVAHALPEPDYRAIAAARRCRLVLTTPGLFADGWLPTGADSSRKREDGAVRFDLHGVRGWIVCAAVPRAEVVSGWDLANWEPKPAQRAAPTGSVWWLELDEGVGMEALRKLAEAGLWREPCEDLGRRAEDFNRLALAQWTG